MKFHSTQLNNVFVTADHHFGHENIIKFCNRPFGEVDEMDRVLIENWNKIVKKNDTVFHLGDFTLGDWGIAERYFQKLNGNIKILANYWHHDKRWLRYLLPENHYGVIKINITANITIEVLPPIVTLEIPELGISKHPLAITLCHYPMAVWDRKHYGAWHLHGHSHGTYQYPANDEYNLMAMDVGVDTMNYHPISLGNVLGEMYERGHV